MAKLTKEEILSILRNEHDRSVGFDGDLSSDELANNRVKALKYYKGDMEDDIPSLPNRSSAVSTDVADNIEMALPQLVEIFLEEDVCSFQPANEQDIEAAQQETDYVNHIIFKQNNGFENLFAAFRDGLLLKNGILTWNWEEAAEPATQRFEGLSEEDFQNLRAMVPDEDRYVEIEEVQELEEIAGENGVIIGSMPRMTYNVEVAGPREEGYVKISSIRPDDCTVSSDTMVLGEGTFCSFRSRLRRQELYADGYKASVIDELPAYVDVNNTINEVRDNANENLVSDDGDASRGFDMVEVKHNYLRVVEDKKVKLYHIVTGGDSMEHILDMNVVTRVPAASFCPFPQPGRFYGFSMADKLFEVQRIKTALLRLGLDSGYYAMNQRMEVVEGTSGKHTLTDLLKNAPGSPIRVKAANTINPVQTGQMTFPVIEMFEQMSVISEQRSGIMRASQGLSPDTLHDTKGGMLALMNSGQIRLRFIARNFAETGFRSLALGVHEMMREHGSVKQTVQLRGKWVAVDPTSWGQRSNMAVEIGNAGGREWDVQALTQILDLQKQGMEAQGGADGPFTSPKFILNTAHKLVSRMGMRSPEVFFPEPDQYQPQPAGQEGPSPEEQKMQMELQMKQMEFQQKMELEKQKMQMDMQANAAKLQSEHQLKMQQMQAQMELDREMAAQKLQLERDRMTAEFQLKKEQLDAELQLNMAVKQAEVEQEAYKIEMGHEANLRDGPSVGGDATV